MFWNESNWNHYFECYDTNLTHDPPNRENIILPPKNEKKSLISAKIGMLEEFVKGACPEKPKNFLSLEKFCNLCYHEISFLDSTKCKQIWLSQYLVINHLEQLGTIIGFDGWLGRIWNLKLRELPESKAIWVRWFLSYHSHEHQMSHQLPPKTYRLNQRKFDKNASFISISFFFYNFFYRIRGFGLTMVICKRKHWFLCIFLFFLLFGWIQSFHFPLNGFSGVFSCHVFFLDIMTKWIYVFSVVFSDFFYIVVRFQ